MKDLIKIVAEPIIISTLVIVLFVSIYNYYEEHHGYRYVTFNDEIGISNKCYMNDKGLFCKIKGGLVEVRQFGKR